MQLRVLEKDQKNLFAKKYTANAILSYFWLPSRKTNLEEPHWHQLNWAKTTADSEFAEPTELGSEQVQPDLPSGAVVWAGICLIQTNPPVTAPGWLRLPPPVNLSLEPNSSSVHDQSSGQGPKPTVTLKVQDVLVWPGNSPDDSGPEQWMMDPSWIKLIAT